MNLQSSRLGTKEYWQNFYEREIENFQQNPNDTGENWFDDVGAENRVVDFIAERAASRLVSILDLGCGNGRLLFSIKDANVEGDFLGIDYAASSVDLARSVAMAEGYDDVAFQHVDFINNREWTSKTYDYVLDKGTLDAIALCGDPEAPKRYVEAVLPRVNSGGLLVITSCNFTQDELAALFGLPFTTIKYPEFSFGGQKGSSVVTLAFQISSND